MADANNQAQKSPKLLKIAKWMWISVGVIVLLVIIASIAGGGANPKASDNKEAARTTQAAPTTTLGKLQQASQDALGDSDGITVKYDKATKTAELTGYQSSFINARDTIGSAYRTFVAWGDKIENMPEVKTIDVRTQTDFTDTHGKTSRETACNVSMSTKNFKTYNWDNLDGQPIYRQIYKDGNMTIHPAIMREIGTLDSVKL